MAHIPIILGIKAIISGTWEVQVSASGSVGAVDSRRADLPGGQGSDRSEWPLAGRAVFWVAVKELTLSYHNKIHSISNVLILTDGNLR